MELDQNEEPLDWEDDLDQAELEDEFDAIAELEAESRPLPSRHESTGWVGWREGMA